jgi:predicted transcriptional regulator
MMGYGQMSKKLNAVVKDAVMEELDRIATEEQRTRSQMADILLSEAISARLKKKADSMTKNDQS